MIKIFFFSLEINAYFKCVLCFKHDGAESKKTWNIVATLKKDTLEFNHR